MLRFVYKGLGLWRELTKKSTYTPHLWKKHLHLSFPCIPSDKNIEAVYHVVDATLKLRNRIAHHEPILGRLDRPAGEKLPKYHADIMMVLGWIDPHVATWAAARTEFPDVFERRPA